MVRIDQQFGQKVNVFYRYLHDTFPEVLSGRASSPRSTIAGRITTRLKNPGTQHLAHGTYIFSPTLLLMRVMRSPTATSS
jgi:hypothetical protein